jgi:hypothetical protein
MSKKKKAIAALCAAAAVAIFLILRVNPGVRVTVYPRLEITRS